jgi:hypothetical protein
MWENLIRAFYKRHGITHPDDHLISTFLEVMSEEIKIAEWIGRQKQDFLLKVLNRAAEKTAAKATKPKDSKPAPSVPSQLSLPTKPEGN